ncbi:Poly-beta-1,6-N-acetyl-D-glucosamine synthase [Anaerolineae bacterium]|nr:Poly-beta-1,6-N-acetyl-D-glucosamine synthase [Anaerolineae bacterium]
MIGLVFWLCVVSIVYTYAGYPLLLTCLARLRPRIPDYPPFTPTMTLLIAAYNEETIITEKLENSLALNYPRELLQILVAADGSDDRTAEIVREYAARGVELSYNPQRLGKMAAINQAMRLVRGEVIVFSDANNFYGVDTVRDLVAPLSDPAVGAVTGVKSILRGDGTLGESEGMYWKYESFIRKQETRLGCCTGVAGEVLAIRHHLFQAPPDNIINDDSYLAWQIIRRGFRVVYVPQARSFERVSPMAQDEITRRSRIIAGRYQLIALAPHLLPFKQPIVVWQIFSHKILRPLVPLAMAGAMLTNLVAVIAPAKDGIGLLNLVPPINWIFLILQIIFYGMALLGNQMEYRGKNKLPFYLYLPTFLVNSNLAALIGLYRFLTRRQTAIWQRVGRQKITPARTTNDRQANSSG